MIENLLKLLGISKEDIDAMVRSTIETQKAMSEMRDLLVKINKDQGETLNLLKGRKK